MFTDKTQQCHRAEEVKLNNASGWYYGFPASYFIFVHLTYGAVYINIGCSINVKINKKSGSVPPNLNINKNNRFGNHTFLLSSKCIHIQPPCSLIKKAFTCHKEKKRMT
jgi:hypothetical protein